ncbi:MAG: hypothetical protein HYY23_06180 [Verrucomicrobia bacterium]|nr:hypothetical protein [Verrucomicrobiota bacterium]
MTANPNPQFKIFLSAALALILGGCVTSLQPLFTDKDLLFDPALIGIWEESEDTTWCFEKQNKEAQDGDKAYRLVVTQKDVASPMLAGLGKLGERRFLCLYPDLEELKERKLGDLYQTALIPGCLIAKVTQDGPTLEVALLNHSWVEKLVEKDPKAIRHEKVEGRIILTAPTEELQQFLLKHADKEEVWEKLTELKRKQPKGFSAVRSQTAPHSQPLNSITKPLPSV